METMYDPLHNLTLPDFARLLLGVDHKMIHRDLERLGYIVSHGKRKTIVTNANHLFRYERYEDGWNPTIRPTEAGRERIVQHYLDGDLSMVKPYTKYTWDGRDSFSFNEHAVAAHAVKVMDRLNSGQRNLVQQIIELNGRRADHTTDFGDFHHRVHELGMFLMAIEVIT